VTVDTALGTKEVRLGESSPSASGATGPSNGGFAQDAGPPPGYRAPPPPASAPAGMNP